MRLRLLALAAGAATMATASLAVAQQWEASGVLAYRQAEMKVLGAHMGAIKSVVTDQRDFLASVPRHAEDIAAVASLIPSLFPEGSGPGGPEGDTDALPAIWESWGDFQAKAENMGKLAGELAATARAGDPLSTAQAFAKLGKEGCGACHENFRKKSS